MAYSALCACHDATSFQFVEYCVIAVCLTKQAEIMSSCGTRLGLSQSGEPLAPPTDWHGWLGGCTSQTILTKL